jgi:hypothetical protein
MPSTRAWIGTRRPLRSNQNPATLLAEAVAKASQALAFLTASLKAIPKEALMLVVPGRQAPELWIVVASGFVDLQAIRSQLPNWELRVETMTAFREAWRVGDKEHRRVVKKHLYVLGPRRLLTELAGREREASRA